MFTDISKLACAVAFELSVTVSVVVNEVGTPGVAVKMCDITA